LASPPNSLPETPPPQPSFPPGPPPENPPWTGWDVVRIVVVGIVVIVVFGIASLWVASGTRFFRGMPPGQLARDPLLIIPAQFAAYLVLVLYMYAVVRKERGYRFLPAVRWNWPQGTWIGFLALGCIVAIASQLLSAILPVPKSLPIDQFFHSPADAWMMAIFGITVAPFVEELFFRGFLYPVLARPLGVAAGIVLTAIPFALLHSAQLGNAWGPLLVLFVVGVVLTGVRAATKSVASSMLVHMGYNLTLFSLLFVASGHFQHLERVGG
jgi:membrane protease YdiL (CAAX protease family)